MSFSSANVKDFLRTKKMRKATHIISYIARLAFLVCVAYIVIYPVLYMLVTSFSAKEAFLSSRRVWIPDSLTTEFYSIAIKAMEYPRALGSTLKYGVVAAFIEVCSCAVTAYGFSRFNFKFKKVFTGMLFVTILIPVAMIVIPLTVNYSQLDVFGILGLVNKLTGVDLRVNILNTPWSFWLPSLLAIGLRSGIMIYIYMQFFKGLPGEFEEAAYVDGAGPLRTFLQIIIPSSTVVILTVSVFSVIWHWNDYQMSVMFMNNDRPLSVSIMNLGNTLQNLGIWPRIYDPTSIATRLAGCVLFILPPLVLYLIVQHWFIESVDRVGITG